MVLAVTGSRHWENITLLRTELDKAIRELNPDKVIMGDARGADAIAYRFLETHWWFLDYERYEVTEEEWKKSRSAGVKRNTKLVEDADRVVAFVSEGKSPGTWDTIRKAKSKGKLYRIVRENGEVENE